jgi:hypothetical protein
VMMRHLRLRSVGGRRPRSGRMIKHREHQANRLRNQAARMDGQILKLLRHKKRLLELAAKLEADCHRPVPPVAEAVEAVPEPADWHWAGEPTCRP